MENKLIFIDVLYHHYINYFESKNDFAYRDEVISFIRNYFDYVRCLFFDLNVSNFFSISSDDLLIIRTKYGVCNNGIFLSFDDTAKKFSIDNEYVVKIVKDCTMKIKDDFRIELGKFLKPLKENSNISIDDLRLSECLISDLGSDYTKSLDDLLCLDIYSSKVCFSLGSLRKANLITLIHSLGLKFNCELSDNSKQNEILGKIRLIGLSEYMKQCGVSGYCVSILDELNLDKYYTDRLKYCVGVNDIDAMLTLSRKQLECMFSDKVDFFIALIHAYGYNFYFEFSKYSISTTDVYEAKVERLNEIQSEISSLELERQNLESEIADLRGKTYKKI